jgi:hypothetical protein
MVNGNQFAEIWEQGAEGCALGAFINGDVGWLMFLRFDGDAGFSSRNPSYTGPAEEEIAYRLQNGQIDRYPASWALPLAEVTRALEYFQKTEERPPFIMWHDDSK